MLIRAQQCVKFSDTWGSEQAGGSAGLKQEQRVLAAIEGYAVTNRR
jgi:hypothetical protein